MLISIPVICLLDVTHLALPTLIGHIVWPEVWLLLVDFFFFICSLPWCRRLLLLLFFFVRVAAEGTGEADHQNEEERSCVQRKSKWPDQRANVLNKRFQASLRWEAILDRLCEVEERRRAHARARVLSFKECHDVDVLLFGTVFFNVLPQLLKLLLLFFHLFLGIFIIYVFCLQLLQLVLGVLVDDIWDVVVTFKHALGRQGQILIGLSRSRVECPKHRLLIRILCIQVYLASKTRESSVVFCVSLRIHLRIFLVVLIGRDTGTDAKVGAHVPVDRLGVDVIELDERLECLLENAVDCSSTSAARSLLLVIVNTTTAAAASTVATGRRLFLEGTLTVVVDEFAAELAGKDKCGSGARP